MDLNSVLQAGLTALQLASAQPSTDDVCDALRDQAHSVSDAIYMINTVRDEINGDLASEGVRVPTRAEIFADNPSLENIALVNAYEAAFDTALTENGIEDPEGYIDTHTKLLLARYRLRTESAAGSCSP